MKNSMLKDMLSNLNGLMGVITFLLAVGGLIRAVFVQDNIMLTASIVFFCASAAVFAIGFLYHQTNKHYDDLATIRKENKEKYLEDRKDSRANLERESLQAAANNAYRIQQFESEHEREMLRLKIEEKRIDKEHERWKTELTIVESEKLADEKRKEQNVRDIKAYNRKQHENTGIHGY